MVADKKKTSSLRAFACAAAASLCMMFSASSQAAAFQVAFDPYESLYGVAVFDLSAPCLASDGTYTLWNGSLIELALDGCTVSLVSAHISTDGANGSFVDYVAEFPYVLLSVLMIQNNQLFGLTTLFPIFLDEMGFSENALALSSLNFNWPPECHATLAFSAPSSGNPSGGVTFRGCENGQLLGPLTGNITSITQLPEPATLALVLGAGFAGWLTRRRKRRA